MIFSQLYSNKMNSYKVFSRDVYRIKHVIIIEAESYKQAKKLAHKENKRYNDSVSYPHRATLIQSN